jgi:hypothetical protein
MKFGGNLFDLGSREVAVDQRTWTTFAGDRGTRACCELCVLTRNRLLPVVRVYHEPIEQLYKLHCNPETIADAGACCHARPCVRFFLSVSAAAHAPDELCATRLSEFATGLKLARA